MSAVQPTDDVSLCASKDLMSTIQSEVCNAASKDVMSTYQSDEWGVGKEGLNLHFQFLMEEMFNNL